MAELSPADAIAPTLRQESDLKEFRRLLKKYFPRVCSRDAEGFVRKVSGEDVHHFLLWEEYGRYDEDLQQRVQKQEAP